MPPIDLTSASGHSELEVLSRRYAVAIDRRDVTAVLSVFTHDATMRVERPGHPIGMISGHRELTGIVRAVERWPRTVHLVAHGLYTVDGTRAHGEVCCTAHHFDSDIAGVGRDHVMHIRYYDRYRLLSDRGWLINHRTVSVEAIEDHPVQSDPR